MLALKHFYRELGDKTWGWMGFKDAFNLQRNWHASSYLAIDQGPIILMIENYRSQLLWNLFMSNPEIQPMLDAIGFYDSPNAVEEFATDPEISVYPNPASGDFQLTFSTERNAEVQLDLYSMTGQLNHNVLNRTMFTPGRHSVNIPKRGMTPGIYMVRLIINGSDIRTARIIIH
jgi:hypothetical protein